MSLVGFQGRAQALQYMPNKHHHKFSINIWDLCESPTGYTLNVNMYSGKPAPSFRLGYDVVMRLLQPYFEYGHHLYVDNYFTSISLAEGLIAKSTYSTSTLRSNRQHVHAIVKVRQKKGDITAARRVLTGIIRSRCFFLSTQPVTYISKWNRTHEGVPHLITNCNKHMGGVDMSDMCCYMFLDERRTLNE